MIYRKDKVGISMMNIVKYVIENKIEELYDDVSIVQKNVNTYYEPPILDAIDLCLESLQSSNKKDIITTIKILKKVRKNIVGEKYDCLKKLFYEGDKKNEN